MAALMSCAYVVMFWLTSEDISNFSTLYRVSLLICFLFIIGFYSGFMGSQERKHYNSSNYYKEMAARDYLTGLYNHMQFQETLNKLEQSGDTFYLIMADIDHFKHINDTYGHTSGDVILKEVGRLLGTIVHDKLGLVFRYGGEEFGIILRTGIKKEAEAVIRQLQQSLRETSFVVAGASIKVTLSLGVASNQYYKQRDRLIEQADRSLYLAKTKGRDCAVFAS